MIGDEFFQLRSNLSSELHQLAELIRDLGGDVESIAIAENLIASLKEPFVFVVVGEVNVGKSTFLNALFGQDFSRTGVIPTTDKILFFKHGPSFQTVPITPTLEEVHVPADFLRDFHIVDTPGTNSIENEHQEITERFVPVADLVIFVFSAMNPWGASAWQFLDKVHKHWMRHVVFVLQQCDLRSPEEVQVITDYMGQLSNQRYGQQFPIFPVSAKKAYLARSSGLDRESLLEQSGYRALEEHISSLVTRHPTRINKLASTTRLGRQLLNNLKLGIEAAAADAQRGATLIEEFLTEREMQADRTLKKILPALDATRRDYQESCQRVAGIAEEALAAKRVFQRDQEDQDDDFTTHRKDSLDHRLFQELQHRTGDRWRQVGIILEEDSLQYARFLHIQGRGILFAEDSPLSVSPDPELRSLFTAHMDSTMRRFVLGLKLDESLLPGLHKARRRARWVPWLLLPTLLAITAIWYFDGPLGAAITGGIGLLVLSFTLLITHTALNHTRALLFDRLDESADLLREMLHQQIQSDVAHVFNRFLPILTPIQAEAARRQQEMTAQNSRIAELARSLQSFEQSLRSS